VERELLLELGCEEIPASWLPALTREFGDALAGQLRERRLPPETAVETFSTPRRLTVRIERIPDRQTDLEELVTGPPVAAGFKADGTPTPAAAGFASKQGIEVSALERIETSKGVYLGYRRRQRGRASVDVLPDVLGGTLRALTFPKLMHWDAMLEDGKGDLLFGRPIRWMLFLYGGRVVPFTIGRTPAAQTGVVQDVTTGAATYGHRFLTTSGRAGRAIKVRSFDEYRARLLENFVILERSERHDRIARELDAKARRLQGRVSRNVRHEGLLQEVPDLVEYPSVIAGTFAPEFLQLPDEVLTTTLIHHQHYFPVEDEHGRLKNAFLAVINTEPDQDRTIARNAERVVSARLRDAQFFWEADRKMTLESRIDRLATLTFHKKLGTYKEKAERIQRLARWIAKEAFGASDEVAEQAATAARLSKTDLTTDMVREFPELQGIMGGVYARLQGRPEEIWKAIYYHYLPIGVEADAAPTRGQLGRASVTWAAVSLADKLDTIVGLFTAGERPTGSRDPFGLRRAAHGVFKILVDLPTLSGIRAPVVQPLLDAAKSNFSESAWDVGQLIYLIAFMLERFEHVLQHRGFDVRNVRAITQRGDGALAQIRPSDELKKLEVLPEFTKTEDFQKLARAFKRVQNMAKELPSDELAMAETRGSQLDDILKDPAELALRDELARRTPVIEAAVVSGSEFRAAFAEASKFGPAVDRFFEQVLVMTDDKDLKIARLRLLRHLETLMLQLANISEMVAEEKQA
jgi:glycyl-tRNA synthetase beta chain